MSTGRRSDEATATEPPETGSSSYAERRRRACGKKNHQRQQAFSGKCDEIRDSVYDVIAGNDTFAQTTREIAEFVARKYKDAGEFRKGMVKMHLPILDEPDTPDKNVTPMDIKIWALNLKDHHKKVEARRTNSDLIYALLLGQCSQAMRNKLAAHKDWALVDEATDVIGLLEILQHSMGEKQTHRTATYYHGSGRESICILTGQEHAQPQVPRQVQGVG